MASTTMQTRTPTPHGARRVTVGWTHPETGGEFRVTGHYWPPQPERGPTYDCAGEPAEPAVFEPVEVVEDRVGGEERPELLDLVSESLDALVSAALEDDDDRRSAACEDAWDADREEQLLAEGC
jgi:hypothetical protein